MQIQTTSWVQALAFQESSIQQKHHPCDIQVHFVPMLVADKELNLKNFGLDEFTQEGRSKPNPMPCGVTFLPSLLQPRSSGYIELASNDPRDHPIIEPRYFSHPDDAKILVEAWKLCDKIASSSSMKSVLEKPLYDESIKCTPGSDEYILCKVQRDALTVSYSNASL